MQLACAQPTRARPESRRRSRPLSPAVRSDKGMGERGAFCGTCRGTKREMARPVHIVHGATSHGRESACATCSSLVLSAACLPERLSHGTLTETCHRAESESHSTVSGMMWRSGIHVNTNHLPSGLCWSCSPAGRNPGRSITRRKRVAAQRKSIVIPSAHTSAERISAGRLPRLPAVPCVPAVPGRKMLLSAMRQPSRYSCNLARR